MSEPAAPISPHGGIVAWFARNHVAANLLMVSIILLGVWGLSTTRVETMPNVQFDQVIVTVPYLGAAPEEVEEAVVIKLEEAIKNVEGVQRVTSTAAEGFGRVMVEIADGYDLAAAMDEIKIAVDGIATFPAETERPIIGKWKFQKSTIAVQVFGGVDETTLKSIADDLRDEIVALPEVTTAEVWGGRPFEIAIEVNEQTLKQYGLTLDHVAQVIRTWSVDLPGGNIRTEGGDIRLRTKGQAYNGDDFASIVLLTRPDGTRLRLSDVAVIRDGFVETESHAFFNGNPSIGVMVFSSDRDNEIEVSEAVRKLVSERSTSLPPGIEISTWADSTHYLKGSLGMLLSNLAQGAVLVFITLAIFLHWKIAGWVLIGLPISFLGAFMLLPLPGIEISINILSLFGFILVLGIVVDDAIVVAESVHTETGKNGYTLDNIIIAAKRVAAPVTFGVLTTIMAFLPMLFVTGPVQALAGSIGWVVILCLSFSLIESKLILPSHLAMMVPARKAPMSVARKDDWLRRFIANVYRPLLVKAIRHRYLTMAIFIATLILAVGVVAGGLVRYVFFPEMGSDYISATVEMTEGVSEARVIEIVDHMSSSLDVVNQQMSEAEGGNDVIQHVFAFVQDGRSGRFQVELTRSENRSTTPADIEDAWRDAVGVVPDTKFVRFESSRHTGGGPPIAFKVSGPDYKNIDVVGSELAAYLRRTNGVFEVESSADQGPLEIKLKILPEAEALGVTLQDLARQVRTAFYGAEAQRIQRGDDEVKVMVRYPRSERISVGNLESMWIRMPDGRELPFSAVATYTMDRGFTAIGRIDNQRAVSITARSDEQVAAPAMVTRKVLEVFAIELKTRYPDVVISLTGSGREEQVAFRSIMIGFAISMFGIYALLAVPLKSYVQPLIIMGVIPFGIIGAIVGHWAMDMAISAISLFGIIALSGVVVNDSLLMIDFVNTAVDEGKPASEAVIDSGAQRFRAVLLTSLTTFFGLLPMLALTSVQAQIVQPMATSLAFGILFSTAITLILVPTLYVIGDDIARALGHGHQEAIPVPQEKF